MTSDKARIRTLNDQLRTALATGASRGKNSILISPMVQELPNAAQATLYQEVADFNDFHNGNDPLREHDFGEIVIGNDIYIWKVDYYGLTLDIGSEDPSDDDQTTRVISILHTSEY